MMHWPEMSSWWRMNKTVRTLCLLLLGQVVSFVLALTSFSSSVIANLGVDAPITQASCNYLALAVVYGGILLYRRQKPLVFWCWYLLLGFLDVQGIFLFNKAYQFTSITSVTMLECLSIAWVIVLTWFFLGTRYSLWQLLGAALCVVGIGFVLLSDVGAGGTGGSRPLLGDTLVVVGTIFYALSSVGEEFCVKNIGRLELLAMIGVYGLFVSTVEIFALEVKALESVEWSADIVLAFAGYTLASFTLYSLFSLFLKMSGATMYILSILTSDMWVVVIRIFFYHQQVAWLYYLAFAIVATGLIIYSTNDKAPAPPVLDEEDGRAENYQVLNDENSESQESERGDVSC